MTDKKRKKVKDILTIVVLSSTIICTTVTIIWSAVIVPKIDKRIECQNQPVIEKLANLENLVAYQNAILIATRDTSDIALIESIFISQKRRVFR